MKILIIEDEEILRKVLEEKFVKEHFDVKTAADGEAGLALAKSFNPDMILLDIILPKKDGMKVLAELKANADFRSTAVIMISNLGEDEKIKEALALGAVDYLIKSQHPINEVVEKVKSYLLKAK
ncbi:MAG: response regulator [Candidatus Falkowbacteria bacterium]